MCEKKNMFVELDVSANDQIPFGDSSKIPLKEKDKILIRLKDDSHQLISNVYYAPDMKNNLLSLRQLLEKGSIIYMEDRYFVSEIKRRG